LPTGTNTENAIQGVMADPEEHTDKTGEVVNDDVEVAVPEVGEKVESAGSQSHAPKKGWWCLQTKRRRLCLVICSITALFMLAVGLAVGLLWPEDPTWSLTKLELLDEAALNSFIMAFGGGYESIADDAEMPPLEFMAEVELYNPNRLGGQTGQGHFKVFFHGEQLGSGTCEPANVEPLSNVTLHANISVQLYPSIFKAIAEAVLANDLKLTVQVSGSTSVSGPLGIGLTCGADCDVHTNTIQVLDPGTRHQVIESKQCNYKYLM